jgi:hypothetical protein
MWISNCPSTICWRTVFPFGHLGALVEDQWTILWGFFFFVGLVTFASLSPKYLRESIKEKGFIFLSVSVHGLQLCTWAEHHDCEHVTEAVPRFLGDSKQRASGKQEWAMDRIPSSVLSQWPKVSSTSPKIVPPSGNQKFSAWACGGHLIFKP